MSIDDPIFFHRWFRKMLLFSCGPFLSLVESTLRSNLYLPRLRDAQRVKVKDWDLEFELSCRAKVVNIFILNYNLLQLKIHFTNNINRYFPTLFWGRRIRLLREAHVFQYSHCLDSIVIFDCCMNYVVFLTWRASPSVSIFGKYSTQLVMM